MDDHLRQLLTQRLAEYLGGGPSPWSGLMAEARRLRALPIGIDLFTALFITPDGDLYAWDLLEEDAGPERLTDETHRIAVLRIAAQWFPELRQLIPPRPETAPECAVCCGTGTQLLPSLSGEPGRFICFACRGVGWEQEGRPQPPDLRPRWSFRTESVPYAAGPAGPAVCFGHLAPLATIPYDLSMRDLDELFAELARSDFRSRQRLSEKDRQYLASGGLDTVLAHAAEFVDKRLAAAEPPRDGKQTPWRGHPVFTAQHATATCCRGCLEKWHGIERGQALTQEQRHYIVRVLRRWLEAYVVIR